MVRLAAHPADSPYQTGLERNPANHAPLTPISFLERAADVFPERTAWIHGDMRASYAAFRARARRLAAALAGARRRPGRHGRGDAAQHAADAGGAFRRADGRRGAQQHQHPPRARDHRLHPRSTARAKVLLTDTEFAPTIKAALEQVRPRPLVVDVGRPAVPGRAASGWAS